MFKTKELKEDGLNALAVGVGYKAAQIVGNMIPQNLKKFAPVGKIALGLLASSNTTGIVKNAGLGMAAEGVVSIADMAIGMVTAPSAGDTSQVAGLKGAIGRAALGEANFPEEMPYMPVYENETTSMVSSGLAAVPLQESGMA